MSINNHSEEILFLVIQSPNQPLVLGIPWLEHHNPHIDCRAWKILDWRNSCLASCLQSAPVPPDENTEEHPDFSNLSQVPPVYLDLRQVFNS